MLITYKDVILYELTIVVSTMVTEALSIDIRGHTYGKGIPGFLWPLCLLTMHGIISSGALPTVRSACCPHCPAICITMLGPRPWSCPTSANTQAVPKGGNGIRWH